MRPPSLPAWGVWIEIRSSKNALALCGSLPAWGVWIEIFAGCGIQKYYAVAPRMGSVD